MNLDSSEEVNIDWPEDRNKTNTELIYNYTEKIFDSIRINVASLNTRLGVTIGFSGLMLRFSLDLPDSFPTSQVLKILSCLLVCSASVLALTGFLTKPTGEYASAKQLLDENYYRPEEMIRLQIIRGWNTGIQGLMNLQQQKNLYLNYAVKALATASLCFGLNIVLDSIYG
ncbi:MAG: hypothetical protein AAFV85_01265 [Cyanobacteria bacterium J06634_6]